MAAPRKTTPPARKAAAPAVTTRTKDEKLAAAQGLAMRLSAALKRCDEPGLARKAFQLAAEIDALIP